MNPFGITTETEAQPGWYQTIRRIVERIRRIERCWPDRSVIAREAETVEAEIYCLLDCNHIPEADADTIIGYVQDMASEIHREEPLLVWRWQRELERVGMHLAESIIWSAGHHGSATPHHADPFAPGATTSLRPEPLCPSLANTDSPPAVPAILTDPAPSARLTHDGAGPSDITWERAQEMAGVL